MTHDGDDLLVRELAFLLPSNPLLGVRIHRLYFLTPSAKVKAIASYEPS